MAGPPPADRRLRCVSTTRRIAAKLHRGDAARRLSLSGRALLPAADPGNVWTGLRPRLQQARSLEAPDLHAEREQSLETVLQALAPYQPILTAPVERRPWRLAVRADEITAVLHHPEGLVWRATPGDDTEAWHPIATLLRHHVRTPAKSGPPAPSGPSGPHPQL